MNPITAPVHSSLSGTAVKTGKGTSTALRGLDLERLVILSAPAMEDLYRQLDSPTTTVLLADSQGGVLRAIGSGCDVGALPGAPQETAQVAARALPALLDEAAPEPAHLAAHLPAKLRANLAAQRVGIAVPILPPGGGDGYTSLGGGRIIVAGGGNLLATDVMNYVEKQGKVAPKVDGRLSQTGK